MEKICKKIIFQKNRKYQLRTQIDLSITFNLDDKVFAVGTESVFPKANGGLLYLYRREKTEEQKMRKKFAEMYRFSWATAMKQC